MSQVKKSHVDFQPDRALLPALDVNFLNTATFNDLELRKEIINLFRQQVKTLADQLLLPLDQGSWRYLTHTLKGSASAVGASELAALADAWEVSACPDTASISKTLASNLMQCLAAFDAVVKAQDLA